jgi:2-succinyl-5-enolpyruvyl-6-hydroxy-3-cyclohexene-1-carboxylate synthase
LIGDISTWSEALIAREISVGLPTGSTLFISSSRPIRDIEACATARSGIETFANRGLAGIDGNISTALGIASQRNETTAVLGDLSFLHDLTGLIHNESINLRLMVIDNNGGGIFSTLSHRGAEGFETVFGTPHNLDISKIAASFGITTLIIENHSQLITELSKPVKGLSVVVVKAPSREDNANFWADLYAAVNSI